jgi:acyl carrier protein
MMDIDDFIKNFASQFEKTDPTTFTAQTRFREEIEEWDSLIALSVIAMVDAEYGVIIKGVDIRNSHTVEDLFNIVKSRK